MLRDKDVLIKNKDVKYGWRRTKSHNYRFETFSHYIAKACLVHLINKTSKSGEPVASISEFEVPSGRKIDVLQLIGKTNELVAYEVETSGDKKDKYVDNIPVMTIDLEKAPSKVKKSFKILEEYFKDFVVGYN